MYRRIPEVLDCWFESGSMPFAQMHYPFENKDHFEKMFPADFISEGIDQTRGWFYTLTVLSACLFDKPAFKNATVNGIIVAADGKKMSKRLKNYTPPDTLLEAQGADALRLYLIHSNLVRAEEMRFCDSGVMEMRRRVLLPWYNAYKFFATYSEVDQWQPSAEPMAYENLLDQWIISRMQTLVTQVNSQLTHYALHGLVGLIATFLDDLTNTYIRLNRARFWAEGMQQDKHLAYQCLFDVLVTFSKLMAPITPFLSESIYQKIRSQQGLLPKESPLSIHMQAYPEPMRTSQNTTLERAVRVMQSTLVLARAKRNDHKIKIKIPLRKLTIVHSDSELITALKPLAPIIKRELNVKSIDYDYDDTKYIHMTAKLNAPKLGKKLGKDFPVVQQKLANLSLDALKTFEKTKQLTVDDYTFSEDDIIVYRQALGESSAASNADITVVLDTTLDEALIAEGVAREMINRIQKIRKAMDFRVDDRIKVRLDCDDRLLAVLTPHLAMIQKETLCNDWAFQATTAQDSKHAVTIDNYHAEIMVETT